MGEIIEIRWHGRGGQGAKTAALLLADAALGEGKHIQAFPEYGPERMGAPVQAFNRISEEPIRLHCQVTNPSIVVVLDTTLAGTVDVVAGLPEDGIILFNTAEEPAAIRKRLSIKGLKIFTVDASGIAKEKIGRDVPNTPMMGALIKVTGLLDFDRMLEDNKKKLTKKFRNKPEVIAGNIEAIETAYQEVKSE
ncbi:MAG: 2-oxoacid:acceptor oxidoreductase family protein [bacterium]|nr:2-oxoacid:acceptor oxidoreductase family protein [bacterium]MDD3804720.1 2-oxoacid:acceptor oxidoreductase family protein [bacterium]MDD4152186.1 2-oxoacid:acceptor oxidoreductase family protein [bacterium]